MGGNACTGLASITRSCRLEPFPGMRTWTLTWYLVLVSNQWPHGCRPCALPTELTRYWNCTKHFEAGLGFEPRARRLWASSSDHWIIPHQNVLQKLAASVGIEPTTLRFKISCSTSELTRNWYNVMNRTKDLKNKVRTRTPFTPWPWYGRFNQPSFVQTWRYWRVSNPRPLPWQGNALPAELQHHNLVRQAGFEPACVQLPFAWFVAKGDTDALFGSSWRARTIDIHFVRVALYQLS